MNQESLELDLQRISSLLGQGRIKEAKINLGLVAQSLLASCDSGKGGLGQKLRLRLLKSLNEIRALELVQKALDTHLEKTQNWFRSVGPCHYADFNEQEKEQTQKIQRIISQI